VGVTDQSPHLPRQKCPRPDGTEGRGLLIVDELASDWGIDALPGDGKRIWFELPR
jgi:hypothetical protein